ncbi:probable pectinesterase/pectinesterase inhibitor 6 [Rutidosis leptorrhynchoides]|uniref:probable pectinesterase/pectinesterase inhibitor 6 n=1 Tax=Rutidosis leptorrhynchoides TaxID=125765 RepID=UPI003A991BAE
MAQTKLSTTNDHRLIQLPEGGVTIQVNLVVAQDDTGDFSTISEAIQASENQRIGTDKFVIYVKTGIYKENVIITQLMTNLTLIGDGIDRTIITNDKNNHQGIPTHNTSTVQVWGSGFVAVGITFENAAGPEYEQAVALLSSSDHSVFYKCSFKGYQDTLSLLNYRQFLRECDIYGTVDFIFGDASAIIQNCNIYVRKPLQGQQNTITAQGRSNPNSNTGFVIQNSRVAPDSTLIDGSVVTFLGRPWREYSRVVYVKCDFEISIDPAGWMPYAGNSEYDRLYYAECMNEGKGAVTDGRVTWPGYHVLMAGDDVEQFSVRNFYNGESWIPQTGVPFYSDI